MTSKTKNSILTIIAAVAVMILWGSLFAFVQWGMKECLPTERSVFDILLFAGARFLLCGLVMLPISLIAYRKEKPMKSIFSTKKTVIGVLLLSLFSIILHYSLTYYSLTLIDSGKTALIKQSGVLIFVCLSFLFFKEDKFSPFKIVAAVLGVASIVVANFSKIGFDFNLGTLLLVLASFCTVASNVVFKKLLGGVNAVVSTGIAFLLGGIVLVATGLIGGGRIANFGQTGLWISVFIVVATIISYSLWYSIVKKNDLSGLFIIKMLEPLFAAIVSVLIPALGTTLGWEHLVSFVLVVLAIVMVNLPSMIKKGKEKDESNAN